jgi:hypothetical protein
MNLESTLEVYGGGPGSGCQGPNCGRHKGSGDVVYHVTHTKNVNKIKKEGLKVGKTPNWTNRGTGMPYGQGYVYTFENQNDARRWAAKMDWDFNRGTGTGHVSVLTVDRGKIPWKEDTADPLHHDEGKWFKTDKPIPAKSILDSEELTGDVVRKVVESDNKRYGR